MHKFPCLQVDVTAFHRPVYTGRHVPAARAVHFLLHLGTVVAEPGDPLLQIEDGSLLPRLEEVLDLVIQYGVIEGTAVTYGLLHDLLLGGIGIEFVQDTLVVFILFLPGIHE